MRTYSVLLAAGVGVLAGLGAVEDGAGVLHDAMPEGRWGLHIAGVGGEGLGPGEQIVAAEEAVELGCQGGLGVERHQREQAG